MMCSFVVHFLVSQLVSVLQDGAAVTGLAIAAASLVAVNTTGNAIYDPIGSIIVGNLLGMVVDALYDCKSEVIGPGFFRFKAEIDFNGVVLVQNYLERTGREEWAKHKIVPGIRHVDIEAHNPEGLSLYNHFRNDRSKSS
ncbi:hypothetical protein GW17_00026258 [Ensete ventricosum]|nr:hypothetical protein GW17_00026258 [Ensete ventricosum]